MAWQFAVALFPLPPRTDELNPFALLCCPARKVQAPEATSLAPKTVGILTGYLVALPSDDPPKNSSSRSEPTIRLCDPVRGRLAEFSPYPITRFPSPLTAPAVNPDPENDPTGCRQHHCGFASHA